MKKDAYICEMAPRDGLQILNRSARIPAKDRVALIEALQRSGLPYIEAGAFVSERRMPAMADTADVLAHCRPYAGQLAALVPNLRYYERFAAAKNLDTVALFVSASESYSVKNTRMSMEEALGAAVAVATAATRDGYRVRAHVSGAFRDLTDENLPTPLDDILHVCTRLREQGEDMVVALADTDGRATVEDVDRVVARVGGAIGLEGVGVHLHDRGGAGLDKARTAWNAGVRVFDAAVGGIGGNPTALDNAVGNVATESLIEMLEAMGASTGVDMEALIDAGELITRMSAAVGDPLPPSPVLARALARRRET
jgi:hydroxymethylglutaryl-CoA lyase